jgi:hypothetical protein
VLNMGIIHAAVNTFNWEFHAPAQTFIWDWICSGKVEYTTFGRAFAEASPMLGDTVMAASLAQLYAIKMKGWDLFHHKFDRGFQCFAQQQARYLVGTGWQRMSFIQGINQHKGYDRLIHRSAACPLYPAECPQNTGGSDHPDYFTPDGGLLWAPSVRPTCTQHYLIELTVIASSCDLQLHVGHNTIAGDVSAKNQACLKLSK